MAFSSRATADNSSQQWVAFQLADERYAIPVSYVREIIASLPLAPVSGVSNHVMGLVNLRGEAITIIDTRQLQDPTYIPVDKEAGYFMILELNGKPIGIRVDKVENVIAIPDDAVDPLPTIGVDNQSGYLEGLFRSHEQLYILMNAKSLLESHCCMEDDAA